MNQDWVNFDVFQRLRCFWEPQNGLGSALVLNCRGVAPMRPSSQTWLWFGTLMDNLMNLTPIVFRVFDSWLLVVLVQSNVMVLAAFMRRCHSEINRRLAEFGTRVGWWLSWYFYINIVSSANNETLAFEWMDMLFI